MKPQLLVLLFGLAASCGGDTAGTDEASEPDARLALDVAGASDLGSSSDAASQADSMTADLDIDLAAAECRSDVDCSDGVFCNGVERCFDGVCFDSPTIQCADRSDCTTDVCDEENEICNYVPDDALCAPGQVCRSKGGCFTPADCAIDSDCDDGLICNGAEVCIGTECQPGAPVECGDGVACTADVCVEGTGECQSVAEHSNCLPTELCVRGVGCSPRPPCASNDDCDDGVFCNGRETCGPTAVCIPGAPPLSPDNIACTIDQCDEALKLVRNTPDNARCSDGLFCNGAEVCHPVNGCGPGAPPVRADGVGCTTDSCNEALQLIEHTPVDANCDDGLFCNGSEVCHPIDDCSPGEPPLVSDGVGCTIDTCSEVNDRILHVAEDSLCDDGLFCNGAEACDPVADCQTISVPALDDGVPCTVDSCDESLDRVVNTPDDSLCAAGDICTASQTCDETAGCLLGPPVDEDDGVACTIDSCDPVTGVAHVPSDAVCDDGQFCNGVETCDAVDDCMPGTPPGDDGNPCTLDSCNEQTDTVSNQTLSNGTVCSNSPRSLCFAGSCTPSRCGDGYVDGGQGEQCDDGGTANGDGCNSTCQTEGGSCNPDGVWTLSQPISYSCFAVTIASGSTITFDADGGLVTGINRDVFGGGLGPMPLLGADAICPGSFSVSVTYAGSCTETYTLSGTFTSATSWTGSFRSQFSGSGCFDCVTAQQSISGSR